MNIVNIVGRLTRDPEIREVVENAVCKFGLAHTVKFKRQDGTMAEDTTFVDVEFWGVGPSSVISKYVQKGDQIAVSGTLRMDSWTDKDGGKRSKLYVKGRDFTLLSNRRDEAAKPQPQPQPQKTKDPYDDDPPF